MLNNKGTLIYLIKIIFTFSVLGNFCYNVSAKTQDINYNISYDVPNVFMGIGNGKVYSRSGPGKEYPVINIYVQKGEPVKILQKHEDWIKISDFDQEEGWIYKNLLSRRHFVIVNSSKKTVPVFGDTKSHSKVKFYIERKTRCKVEKCTNQFCRIEYKSKKGWILKKNLWGISDINISK